MQSFKKWISGIYYNVHLALHYKGEINKKFRFYKYAKMCRGKGVIYFRIERLATDYTNAWYEMRNMPEQEKTWYIEHGYNPAKKYFCGVTPDNYKKYISDFEFYATSSYKNIHSHMWFDNKLNTYYLLKPFSEFLPKHYYYAKAGVIYPLDVNNKCNVSSKEIVELVKTKKEIAAKKILGGHGEGFYKLEYSNGVFLANDKESTESDLRGLINELDGYIITDFVKPAKYLREIGGEDAFGVIRAMVIYDDVDGPQFERLMLRLGTSKSGHTQAGHDYLYIGIDENGSFMDPLIELSDYEFKKTDVHPDTGKPLLGNSLRNLDKLKSIVKAISGYLPTTPYLILDIIPTDDSFLILEINSHGQPFNFEPFHPVKESEYFRKLFDLSI